MPYYKKGDAGKSVLLKHSKWDEDYFAKDFDEINYQIIAENIDGPVTPNILCRFTEKYTEAFILLMLKDKYILGLISQDLKNLSNKQIVLDIFKSIRFISEEEFESEIKKCPDC
ncbi:hypothetical protein EG832_02645 [bacterium]|nr:hypothetical protein [bacterium]